ncbi:MAG: DUF1800 domain-containing protein [Planctomycetia bacterium]|nr:DUF1800 domain-containing protein [Planctomycetia bacterium]
MALQADLEKVDPAWAWAAYEPSAEMPWNFARAAHLYRRAVFGGTWAQLQAAVKDGPQPTVERLLAGDAAKDHALFYRQATGMARTVLATGNTQSLPPWWLYVLRHTPHPLLEKLTLFWHGHFATSASKVTNGKLMFRQNQLLRQHARSKFEPLVQGLSKDPAMLIWLDSATNRKAHPNENYSREVMELFCLGLGAYTENDIKQAARAFTGWEVRGEQFFFNVRQHDTGQKTVLGEKGNLNGDDVVRILLKQPAAGRFLAGKVYHLLVSDAAPPEKLLTPLAQGYRDHEYDTSWLVGTILRSNLFFSQHALQQRIKSPVELAIGLLRSLDAPANFVALADDLRPLGQDVFFPPNVKGWDGGVEWINSAALLGRANLVWAIVAGQDERYGNKVRLQEMIAEAGVKPGAEAARFFVELLLSVPLPDETMVQLTTVSSQADGDEHLALARIVQAVAALPEFQLC